MDLANTLPVLLGLACLVPLVSFVLIVLFGARMGKHGEYAAYVATGAILIAFALSSVAMVGWMGEHKPDSAHAEHADGADHTSDTTHAAAASHAGEAGHTADAAHHVSHSDHAKPEYSGEIYPLAVIGTQLKLSISYYIDTLTVVMFCMVTLIASCIHFYAIGYMHDELHEVTDHEVHLRNGHHLVRPGRFHRFFQYLSLFCFSMLSLVYAGNIAMVFVFWELVGICSYFLIGFYFERHSASNAANKAFITNRVGDFGMLIGMMALWGSLGTFTFADTKGADGQVVQVGIFSQVRTEENHFELVVPDGMVRAAAASQVGELVGKRSLTPEAAAAQVAAETPGWREQGFGYWLLCIAGLGIFCGCVGKSAQFPLHVWLPDAMEGPTPVSALVHSATMVAAGVYLVGRFYPVFTPEVLLVIAYIGGITLFIAATIAITAVDIKRVLAYSTVSQLGYMMLALGIGGWVAGLFHLITHAFFKSLLFMCPGSVIHACHTNDMTKMGGLRHKMPWTAYTMLIGCLAIIGAGIPFVIGFSGYYSKDAIIAQALTFKNANPDHAVLFYTAAGGAALTAFYMFRLWFMTFSGPPRDHHIYDHAHESPRVMYIPLVILSVFAVSVGWGIFHLTDLLEQARPAGILTKATGTLLTVTIPNEHDSHEHAIHTAATWIAFGTALSGLLVAVLFYGIRKVDPAEVQQTFRPIYRFLVNKWHFDELYRAIFIHPLLFLSRRVADIDRSVIDPFINRCAWGVRKLAVLDDAIDRLGVDAAVNVTARGIRALGNSLRVVQTGQLRQYVTFIVIGTVALFVLASFVWSYSWAGN
ncbi:MAG: NADH-quinone oxidoreductase subunit L [Planctomycetota bacterium]|nr:NADH-quinone oxidoreductase subunit L [Planctomycetota bacterium]